MKKSTAYLGAALIVPALLTYVAVAFGLSQLGSKAAVGLPEFGIGLPAVDSTQHPIIPRQTNNSFNK